MKTEIYNPVEPNFYNYDAINFLQKDLENFIFEENGPIMIHICGYEVVNNSKYPFLKYLLLKDIYDDELKFPELPYIGQTNNNASNILNYIDNYLSELLLLQDVSVIKLKSKFVGYLQYDKEVFIFYDLTECELNINDIYSSNIMWFTLIDEIINTKTLCNFNVSEKTTSFFNYNPEFCVLKDPKNENYESPVVAYVARDDKRLNFTYIFGVSHSSDTNAILGPSYYFTDFKNSFTCKNSHKISIIPQKKGVIRFALFLGKTKIINNNSGDENDESDIKRERLLDEKLDTKYEALTMRITDHDGKWVSSYDSVYLSNILLDDGNYFKNGPIFAIKDYEQQHPISYHYIVD